MCFVNIAPPHTLKNPNSGKNRAKIVRETGKVTERCLYFFRCVVRLQTYAKNKSPCKREEYNQFYVSRISPKNGV